MQTAQVPRIVRNLKGGKYKAQDPKVFKALENFGLLFNFPARNRFLFCNYLLDSVILLQRSRRKELYEARMLPYKNKNMYTCMCMRIYVCAYVDLYK